MPLTKISPNNLHQTVSTMVSTMVSENAVDSAAVVLLVDSSFNNLIGGQGLTYTANTKTFDITNSGVTAGSYGSASLVPVLTLNAKGQVTSASTVSVAGVSSAAFDSASGIFTINTADGGSFPTHIVSADSDFVKTVQFASLTVNDSATVGGMLVKGHIKPDVTEVYDLGDSDKRFKDLYLSGNTLNMAGTSIQVDASGDIEIKDKQNTFKRIKAKEVELNDSAGDNFKTVLKKSSGRVAFVKIRKSDGAELSDSDADPLNFLANTTKDLKESGNLYFTNERVDDRVGALIVGGNNITSTYNDAAGTLTIDGQPGYADSDVASYLGANGYGTSSSIIGTITASAPSTLDTLNELAAALGDDANFSTTVTNSIAAKLPLAGGTMTAPLTIDTNTNGMLRLSATNSSPWAIDLQRDDTTNSRVYNGGGFWSFEHEPRYHNGGSFQKLFHDSYHPNADKWTTSRTLSLTGDVTGSVSWDGSGNASLAATVANDSHTHVFGNITSTSLSSSSNLDGHTTRALAHWGSSNPANSPGAYGAMFVIPDGSQSQQLVQTYGGAANKVSLYGRRKTGGTWDTSWTQYFSDHYHPNADTLTTARTINGVSFNGSANITVADSTKLPLTGGTVSGNLTVNDVTFKSGSNVSRNLKIQPSATSTDVGASFFNGGGSWTMQLYGYNSGSTQTYGFLDANWGAWDIQKVPSGPFKVDEGSGLQRVFNDAYHPNADTLTTARTINGVSFNGSANITVADSTKLPLAGGTITGHLGIGGAATDASWGDATYGNTEVSIDGGGGYGVLHFRGDGAGTTDTRYSVGVGNSIFYMAYDDVDGVHRAKINASHQLILNEGSGDVRAFHDGYHPNADAWTTARTLSLSGDASGSVSWDGSANATLSVAVANDSHSHKILKTSGNYAWSNSTTAGNYPTTDGSPGIQTSFVGPAQGWPDYGAVLHVGARGGTDAGGDFQLYCGHGSGNGGNYLRVRNADNSATPTDSWTAWRTVWDSGNDGSGSGLDADLLDGVQASSFLRSDTSDTASGSYSFTNSYNEFGNSTGSVSNDGSWNARVNIAGSSHAKLDVKSVSDGIITTMYSHTGQNAGRVGTSSDHPLILMTNGNNRASLSTAGSLSTTVQGTLWGDSNDGSSSGLDADKLDGMHHTAFGATLATYGTTSGSSGRIRCTAPFTTNSAHMFQITVSVYSGYVTHTYVVGGYMYPTTNQWYSPTCIYSGGGNPDIVVGRDANGKAYISIANGNYSGVRVHNMTRGYQTTVADTYDPWTISITGGTENSVTPTVSKVWHSTNDGSGSGLDADTVDGIQGANFLRSDTADTASGDITFSGGAGAISVAAASDIRFGDGTWTGEQDGKIQYHSNGFYLQAPNLRFRNSGGSNVMVVDASGNMTISGTVDGRDIAGDGTKLDGISAGANVGLPESGGTMTGSINLNNNGLTGCSSITAINDTNTYMQFHAADQWRVVTGANERLEVNNTLITASVYISAPYFTATSDVNLKTDIKKIVNPLEMISNLNGYTFNWKESGKASAGVIAQEVEKVLPSAISENKEGSKTVNYNEIIGVLIEAIKDQQKQIDALKLGNL